MRITLKNNFHNTTVNLNIKDNKLSKHQMKRAKNELCGINGCTCSDTLGVRGPQGLDIVETVNDFYIY